MDASLRRRVASTARIVVLSSIEGRFPFRSLEAIERVQRRRVAASVAHAREHVPYYRETLRRLGLGPPDFRTAADLTKLPLIEREQLQRDPEYFVSRAEPLAAYVEVQSGGSTGEPISFYRDLAGIFDRFLRVSRSWAVVYRVLGKRWRTRHAHILPPIGSSASTNRAFNRARVLTNIRNVHRDFSLFLPPAELVPQLDAFRPDVLSGYGSYIEGLFAYLLSSRRPFHRPKVVVFAAEPMSDSMRAELEALGIAVLSYYQSVESPQIGFECERHTGYHLNIDLCPVRVIDPNGGEAAPGEPGRITISNLINRGTVLLNYALDDVATALPGRCECGRSLPLISFLEGRADDWITTRSGRAVHPQTVRRIMRSKPQVWRYQIVQEAPGEIRFVIVPSRGADRERLSREITAEAASLDDPLSIEVTFTDSLPRTDGGKVRSVIRTMGTR